MAKNHDPMKSRGFFKSSVGKAYLVTGLTLTVIVADTSA